MKWLYKLLGFQEQTIIASNDIGDITIKGADKDGEPIYVDGDTIWYKEGYCRYRDLK